MFPRYFRERRSRGKGGGDGGENMSEEGSFDSKHAAPIWHTSCLTTSSTCARYGYYRNLDSS